MLNKDTIYAAIPVTDIKEAAKFYRGVLGLHVIDQNESGLWLQCGQSRIAVFESKGAGTNQATTAIWEVADPAKTVKSLKRRGIKFERYDDLPGVKRIGDLHKSRSYVAAWFKDPFGNLICITHHL